MFIHFFFLVRFSPTKPKLSRNFFIGSRAETSQEDDGVVRFRIRFLVQVLTSVE